MKLTKIAGAFLKLRHRWLGKAPTINMVEELNRVQNVLIYMPTQIEQFGAALKSLEKLRKLLPGWKITVICKREMQNFVEEKLNVQILSYSDEDINIWGLPKSGVKQHFLNFSYDLALDFKLNFDPVCITLFRLSGAPIKVCIDNKDKSLFYNFEIRVNPAETYVNKFNAMIKYINVIASSLEREKTINKPKSGIPK